MAGPASMKDVAKHAGVSLGTVSNVLNRPELVSDATAAKVQAAILELGFVRNESARQLRAGRSRTVAYLALDARNPFFTDVAQGADLEAAEAGLLVYLANSALNIERERRHLDLLLEKRVAGVLITPVGSTSDYLGTWTDRGLPIVLVDRVASDDELCSVSVDDVQGGRTAIEHLLSLGHRRIAFAGGLLDVPQIADRLTGARAAIAEAEDAELVLIECEACTVADGLHAGQVLADTPAAKRPTAVFCANDLVALGVLQVMTARSIRVPDDLAIVGYDDIEFAAAAAVPLTSMRQPRDDLGRLAARMLIDEHREGDEHEHRHHRLTSELVVRASTVQPR